MNYFVRQEKSRVFNIEKNNQPIYQLKFPSWSSSNAIAQLIDGELKFTKKGFWKSEYILTKKDRPLGRITSNWKGHLFIHLLDQSGFVPSNMDNDMDKVSYITYKFKSRGIFKQRYELLQNKDPQPLITLHAKSNWFKVNYEVALNHPDLIDFPLEALLGILTFCAVLIRKRQAAATGAA